MKLKMLKPTVPVLGSIVQEKLKRLKTLKPRATPNGGTTTEDVRAPDDLPRTAR